MASARAVTALHCSAGSLLNGLFVVGSAAPMH